MENENEMLSLRSFEGEPPLMVESPFGEEEELTGVLRIDYENGEFYNDYKASDVEYRSAEDKAAVNIIKLFFEEYPKQVFRLSKLREAYQKKFYPQPPSLFYQHLLLIAAGLADVSELISPSTAKEYGLGEKHLMLVNNGYDSRTFYQFLKHIRKNKYTPEQTEEYFHKFQKLLENHPEYLYEGFCEELEGRNYNLSSNLAIDLISRSLATGYYGTRKPSEDDANTDPAVLKEQLKKQIAVFEHFLSRKDELSALINQHNLFHMQNHEHQFVFITTDENRLCKEPPKPSSAALLQKETITKHWTHKSGRDVYRIHREYKIPVQDTSSLSGYRKAYYWAKSMGCSSNAEKHISFPCLPHVNPNTIAYRCNYHITRRKLYQAVLSQTRFKPRFSRTPLYDTMVFSFCDDYYPIFRERTAEIFDKILKQDCSSGFEDLHDILYPYVGLPKKVLTPSVLEHLLSLPVGQLQKEWGFLDMLASRRPQKKTTKENQRFQEENRLIRRIIYRGFRKGLSPQEIEASLNQHWEQQLVKEYNLSHEQLRQVTEHYLPVIRRYKQKRVTPVEFLRIFGKDGIRTVLSPKKDCIFQPAGYMLPSMEKTVLASLVHEQLGTLQDEENLSARRRLYHRLDVICPVEDILKGDFPEADIPRIKKALNLSPNKTLNLAGYFSAKIEEKCSPEFLIAGDASVCCMGLGSEKATKYALQPGFGIFNVYFKDRIIANSLLWVNNEDTLVIDNIEVHQNYKQYDAYIREMYHQMIKDMHRIYPNIVQGETYNDLELYTDKSPHGKLEKWIPVKISGNFYSDAQNGCYVIKGDDSVLRQRHPDTLGLFSDRPVAEDEWGEIRPVQFI